MTAERTAPHDPRAALAEACAALKVFPLPGVVLLPGAPAPFHLFEPRYRALGAAVLAGDRVLAVPTLVDPEEAMQERPALRPVAGAGLVVAEQVNQDGTIDLVVQGATRVRLLEELHRGHPYREFRAELLHDVYPASGAGPLQGDVEALGQLVYELAGLLPPESGAGQLAAAVARMRVPGAMADLVAAAAISEPAARYQVLETLDVGKRLALVKEEIAGVILLLSRGKTPSA
ncbi:MAG: LON peptidase substrate-binding domain-containing protein [Anaeromyxobacter sp.]|nr:LON peptidase substrate-binding domain-containing protein [Anaeromyxobacter sp.]MBL0278436.1 LON peptidase substrate-binding domain-containing protein [Anaeromyxobacter sp.]